MSDLLLLDGANILVRAIKATERTALTSHDGTPTAAIVAFIGSITRVLREEDPKRAMVCWDGGRSQHRLAIWDGYKANRPERVVHEGINDLPTPFELAEEFLRLAGVPQIRLPGVEADDVIYHLWSTRPLKQTCTIVSGDKDFVQLVDGYTVLVPPQGGTTIDEKAVVETYGCAPMQTPLLMALTGDKIDGINGVPGFGPVKATKVCREAGWSLNAVLAHEKVAPHRALVERNYDLIALRRGPLLGEQISLPVPSLRLTMPPDPQWRQLVAWFNRYQMTNLRMRLESGRLWDIRARAEVARS